MSVPDALAESSAGAEPYRPPTTDELERLLAKGRPTAGAPPWLRVVVPAAVGLVVLSLVLSVMGAHDVAALLPLLGVVAAVLAVRWRARRERNASEAVHRAHELSAMRRPKQALAEAWRLWPASSQAPMRRRQLLAVMAQSLEELGAWEQAVRVFDELLDSLPQPSPPELMLRLRRAAVLVSCERLTDVDDELRATRPRLPVGQRHLASAMFRLTELLRDAATGHIDRLESLGDPLMDELRPLGVDAALGYTAAAVCLAREAQARDTRAQAQPVRRVGAALGDDAGPEPERLRALARDWWRRALALSPAGPLLARTPEAGRWLEDGTLKDPAG
ncbi:MAG: hypothetical protein AAF288_03320 [Planctomycetota bacterium]